MPSSHFSAYIEIRHLTQGHCDTVNSLSFSPGGTHLASGGDDTALCIWNISRGHLLYRLLFDEAIDCVLWHPIHAETVIVGLANGYMFQVYGFSLLTTRRQPIDLGARSTVFCFDYDSSSGCLAIGMGEQVHITREVSQNTYDGDLILFGPGEATGIAASDERMRPVAVKFHKNGTNLIASFINHGVICWDTTTRDIVWHMTMPAQTPSIGGSALNPTHRYLAVYNVVNGLDLYNVGGNGPQSPRKIYRFKKHSQSVLQLQVRFIHGGKALVSGTTSGAVLVWETGTGEALQELSHGDDVIQAVDAVTYDQNSYIATGAANKDQGTYIKIWRAKIANDAVGYELPDAVGRIVQAVTARRLSANEVVTGIINFTVGLAICIFVGWAGTTKVPWTIVWEYSLLATVHSASAARVAAETAARRGRDLASYLSKEGSAMAIRILDALRDACLAFLFPTGAPHLPAADL